jgi:hypothetical protein
MRRKNLLFLYCHCIVIKKSEKLLCAQITEVDADGSPKKDKEKVTEFLPWNISGIDGLLFCNHVPSFLYLQKIVQLEPYPDS